MALRLIPRRVAIESIAASRSGSKRKATGTFLDLTGAGEDAPEMNRSADLRSISFVSCLGFLCTAIVYHFHIILIDAKASQKTEQFGDGIGVAWLYRQNGKPLPCPV